MFDTQIKFRTPMKCKGGHFRYYYSVFSHGIINPYWGNKHIGCKCETFTPYETVDERFTGFKDIHKKYYENDIIVFDSDELNGRRVNRILWEYNRFYLTNEEGTPSVWDLGRYYERYEIVGNIHQNKGLCKKLWDRLHPRKYD